MEDYSASCPLDEGFRNRSDTAEFVHVECQPSVQSQETESMDWTEVYIISFFVAPVRIAITALAKEFKASKDLEIITICTLFNSGQQTGKHISSVVNMWGQILMNDVERDESC